MAETTKYHGKELNWNQLVKKLGIDKARVEAPELDPKYQQMVKKEGQAKGSADYSHQYIDPQTMTRPGLDLTMEDWRIGTEALKKRGGILPTAIADLATLEQHGPALAVGGLAGLAASSKDSAIGRALIGGKAPTTDPKKDPAATTGGKTSTAQTLAQAEDQAINQMYQGLLGQFTQAQNVVNPYISGQTGAQAATNAQQFAQGLAGGGVQGPNPTTAGILNKDFQAYAQANQAGQQGIANAIQGENQAAQAATNVAPYAQLLQALASKSQYNIVYGGGQPNVAAAPPYVQEALNNANQFAPISSGGASAVGAPAPAAGTTASGSAVPAAGSYQSSTGQ